MSNQKSNNWTMRLWVGLALLSATLIMSACSSGGAAAQPGQAVVSQPQSQPAANTPQPFATANRPGGQPTPQPAEVIPAAPPLPASAGKALLDDNFSNTPISNYTIVDLGAAPDNPRSTWYIKDRALIQNGDATGNPGSYETLALTGDAAWTDYSVEAQAYSGGTPLGLVARYSQAGFYRLRVNRSAVTGAGWRLERYDSSTHSYTALAQGQIGSGYVMRKWSYLKLTAQGSVISVTVNGQAVVNVTDTTYKSGSVGVYAEATGARFTNLRVTALQ